MPKGGKPYREGENPGQPLPSLKRLSNADGATKPAPVGKLQTIMDKGFETNHVKP
jgi:hypothetical protein